MAERGQEPQLRDLLERIRQLESQVSAMRKQVVPMKTKLDDLGRAFENEIKSTSSHFKSVYQYIRDINIQLWPLVHKVFPGSAKTQRQIASIIKPADKSSGKARRT